MAGGDRSVAKHYDVSTMEAHPRLTPRAVMIGGEVMELSDHRRYRRMRSITLRLFEVLGHPEITPKELNEVVEREDFYEAVEELVDGLALKRMNE